MPDLFPTFDVPIIQENKEKHNIGYYDSIAFDFEKGDFVLDGTGKIKIAGGIEAWIQFCTKMLMTERFDHLAYSSGTGTELRAVNNISDLKEQESLLEKNITESLLSDPQGRTESVKDFRFEHLDGDSITVTFTITGVKGDTVDLSLGITERGVTNIWKV